jgi:hypothetical protein
METRVTPAGTAVGRADASAMAGLLDLMPRWIFDADVDAQAAPMGQGTDVLERLGHEIDDSTAQAVLRASGIS